MALTERWEMVAMDTMEKVAGGAVGYGRGRTRPAWAVGGGAGITVGGALLMIATFIEVPLAESSDPAMLGLFTALFLGSAVAHAVAMIFLSGGRSGSEGIVGASLIGRFALLGFGAVFLTSQTVYFAVAYALPEVDDYSGVLILSIAISALQLTLLLVGSIVAARAGVAVGAARWALLAVTGASVVTGVVANATDDAAVATVALLCSTGAQIVVGLVLATARSRAR